MMREIMLFDLGCRFSRNITEVQALSVRTKDLRQVYQKDMDSIVDVILSAAEEGGALRRETSLDGRSHGSDQAFARLNRA